MCRKSLLIKAPGLVPAGVADARLPPQTRDVPPPQQPVLLLTGAAHLVLAGPGVPVPDWPGG